MMAFCMRKIALFLALCHVRSLVATIYPCESCGSLNLSPAPEAASLELPPLPPADSLESNIAPPLPPAGSLRSNKVPEDGVFDVTEHGAVADGRTESSSAFSAAWDAACGHPGQSTFYIPEGTFLVGPISFPGPCYDNKSPNIEMKGTLLAPTSLSAFDSSNWIAFRNLQGLTLTGGGTKTGKLDGQGAAEAWKQPSCEKSARCEKLITSIDFINVSHATISDITLSNSKSFHLGLHGSNYINIFNLNITAPGDSPNTDGIHVSESSNINISSSAIRVGDDCVSIGPGSINITVSDVHCGPGHGISVGSLGHYDNDADVSGIVVKNCNLTKTDNGLRIKTYKDSSPSKASGIIFRDIVVTLVKNPIIIDQEYGNKGSNKPSKVSISDVFFTNIVGTTIDKTAVDLTCSSSNPCQGIHLNNVNLKYVGPPADDPYASNCANAEVTYVGPQSPPPCK